MSFFGLRCCGKRVEGLLEKAAIQCRFQALRCCCSSSREKSFDVVFTFLHWMLRYRSRKKMSARYFLFASKPCGTGVEKDFQKVRNRMSFFGSPCCCKGMERPSKYRLPMPANRTLRKIFQEISKLLSFWRLKGCGRGVGGVFARDWLRFGARCERAPGVGSVSAPKS